MHTTKIPSISEKVIERPKHGTIRICIGFFVAVGVLVSVAILVAVSVYLHENDKKCKVDDSYQMYAGALTEIERHALVQEVVTALKPMIRQTIQETLHGTSTEKPTTRNTNAPAPGTYFTRWFNRDHPSGVGDWENLHEQVDSYGLSAICGNDTVIGAECRFVGGDGTLTRDMEHPQVFKEGHNCTKKGLICLNEDNHYCLDYEVRFECQPLCWVYSFLAVDRVNMNCIPMAHN